MAAPTELNRYSIVDLHVPPDVTGLENVLPPRDAEPITELRPLGEQIIAISETLPKAGLQGTFGYIYGSLTHLLADGVHRRAYNGNYQLPKIEQPDDLAVQAGHFALKWTNPLHDYTDWVRADQRGDQAAKREAEERMGPYWEYALLTPAVQTARPPVQFVGGGMGQHILGSQDLLPSLGESGVSDEYMEETYFTVDEYIRITTMERAPEMVNGKPGLVRIGVSPVPPVIALMRRWTHGRFYKMQKLEDPEDHARIEARADRDALLVGRATVQYGKFALGAFDVATGGMTWRKMRDQQTGAGSEAA